MPSITVTVTPDGAPTPVEPATVSHTSHDDADGVLAAKFDGAPGMPTSGPRGRFGDLAGPNQVRVVRPPGDQPRRCQVQRRIQLVTHADVQRAGVTVGDDRRLVDLAGRADERPQQRAQADHQRRGDRGHDRQRLTPSGLDFHADTPAGQRHRGPASKELITGHLGPGRQPEAVPRPSLPATLFRHVYSPSGLLERLDIVPEDIRARITSTTVRDPHGPRHACSAGSLLFTSRRVDESGHFRVCRVAGPCERCRQRRWHFRYSPLDPPAGFFTSSLGMLAVDGRLVLSNAHFAGLLRHTTVTESAPASGRCRPSRVAAALEARWAT